MRRGILSASTLPPHTTTQPFILTGGRVVHPDTPAHATSPTRRCATNSSSPNPDSCFAGPAPGSVLPFDRGPEKTRVAVAVPGGLSAGRRNLCGNLAALAPHRRGGAAQAHAGSQRGGLLR